MTRGQGSGVGGQWKLEVRSTKCEGGRQKAEVGSQRAEGRRQKSEARRQKSESSGRLSAEETFERLWQETQSFWRPQIVMGLFPAKLTDKGLSIRASARSDVTLSISKSFRQRLEQRWGDREFPVAVQVVTVGSKVVQYARKLAKAGNIAEQFLVHGLAAELTEALAKHSQRQVEKTAGWGRSRRYSPGYPVLPELADQKAIFKLLKPERIGVRLTPGFQMVPEYSTSALVIPAVEEGEQA
jgi:cobalamin-dependent methionine synthase I